MKLVEPTAATAAHDNTRASRLDSLEGRTIGLLANGKVNADVLLEETAAIFAEQHGCRILPLVFKRNASAPAPAETISDLASRADLLITASGD